MPKPHAQAALTASVLAAFAALAAGCAKSPKDAPSGSARPEPEAPATVTVRAGGRFAGTVAGHRFTIAIEDARVVHGGPDAWRWRLGAGEVAVEEIGPADASTEFLVERSPRTIVRGGDGFTLFTEVVLVAGGRAFRCSHEERVDDPDAPAAKAATERGVAACTSLRVEP